MHIEWRETVENGQHTLECDFAGQHLTISETSIPDAWCCRLPNGKRAVGSLHIVKWLAEGQLILASDGACKVMD